MWRAVDESKVLEVKKLLDEGADANGTDATQGLSIFHWACGKGDIDVVEALIANGADINMMHSMEDVQCLPLHLAAKQGHKDICVTLIEHGSRLDVKWRSGDPRLAHNNGLTPTELAEQKGYSSVGRLLRAAASGASIPGRPMGNGVLPPSVTAPRSAPRVLQPGNQVQPPTSPMARTVSMTAPMGLAHSAAGYEGLSSSASSAHHRPRAGSEDSGSASELSSGPAVIPPSTPVGFDIHRHFLGNVPIHQQGGPAGRMPPPNPQLGSSPMPSSPLPQHGAAGLTISFPPDSVDESLDSSIGSEGASSNGGYVRVAMPHHAWAAQAMPIAPQNLQPSGNTAALERQLTDVMEQLLELKRDFRDLKADHRSLKEENRDLRRRVQLMEDAESRTIM